MRISLGLRAMAVIGSAAAALLTSSAALADGGGSVTVKTTGSEVLGSFVCTTTTCTDQFAGTATVSFNGYKFPVKVADVVTIGTPYVNTSNQVCFPLSRAEVLSLGSYAWLHVAASGTGCLVGSTFSYSGTWNITSLGVHGSGTETGTMALPGLGFTYTGSGTVTYGEGDE